MPASPAQDSIGSYAGRKIGGYRVGSLLGEGGMATVYSATDDREVACAIKFLRRDLADAALVRRFARETKLAATLDHRHLVPVLDAGMDGEVPYLVMPLVGGTDLGRLLGEVELLSPTTAVRIAIQACAGLEELHRAGIVHRDVKPRNILLADGSAGEVVVKICDFGIAKPLGIEEHSQLTNTGVELGSPLFMSPEQARDSKHVDERGDVFSLATTLYKMLTGKLPHDASAGLAAYLIALTRGHATPVRKAAPWVEPGLAVVVNRGLERDPALRWPSARAFAAALEPFAGESLAISTEMLRPLAEEERVVAGERAPEGGVEETGSDTGRTIPSSLHADKRLASLESLVGRDLGGKYRVLAVIGRGGMGAVLEVRTPSGERAAAKVIDRREVGEGEQTLVRFVREARAASTIASPHVVKTIDVGHDETLQAPFIVMELLCGVDLRTLFKQRAPIFPAPLLRAFVQAARGLAAAHAKGIVHRDIKPANLFAHEEPGSGRLVIKLCDFGVAKRSPLESDHDSTSQELTQTGGLLGSPMYMSPEQAVNAKNVDYRTDIWSLSISLYEGLSGRKVWAGRSTLGEIILAICTHPIPPLCEVAPWIEPALAEVVHRGLREDPERRWASVEEMIAALEPFTEGTVELGLDDLRAVPDALREQIVTPMPPPIRARGARSDDTQAVDVAGQDAAGKRRTWHLVAFALGALAFGAVALPLRLADRGAPRSDAGPSTSSGDLAQPPASATISARVRVVPDGAEVRVDGAARPVAGGIVELEGHVGQAFQLVAVADGAEARQTIVISSDGQAHPDRIEIVAAATEGSSRPRVPLGAAHTGKAPAAPSVEPSAPPPRPSAAPTATSAAEPSFKDTW